VSARYKVYILDEVHMLSGAAFNAACSRRGRAAAARQFVFATTETRKVPVTVLSRCQRFDLRRVDADVLVKHLASIAAKEADRAETEGLALIARAARVGARFALAARPGDRACGRAGARRGRAADARPCRPHPYIDLFEAVMRAICPRAIWPSLRAQYDTGADPAVVLSDLAESPISSPA